MIGAAKGVVLEPFLKAKEPQDFVLPLSFESILLQKLSQRGTIM